MSLFFIIKKSKFKNPLSGNRTRILSVVQKDMDHYAKNASILLLLILSKKDLKEFVGD